MSLFQEKNIVIGGRCNFALKQARSVYRYVPAAGVLLDVHIDVMPGLSLFNRYLLAASLTQFEHAVLGMNCCVVLVLQHCSSTTVVYSY